MKLYLKIKSGIILAIIYFFSLTANAQTMGSSSEISTPGLKLFFGNLGSFEINQTWFFFGLIILMLIAFIFGWFSYDNWLEQVDRRVTVAQRDVKNIIDNIDDDINELLKNYTSGNPDKTHISQMQALLKNMKNNIEKSRRYIIDNIREIEK